MSWVVVVVILTTFGKFCLIALIDVATNPDNFWQKLISNQFYPKRYTGCIIIQIEVTLQSLKIV
jgi:hypothetical protein